MSNASDEELFRTSSVFGVKTRMKYRARIGMSSRRSRSGGTKNGITFSR